MVPSNFTISQPFLHSTTNWTIPITIQSVHGSGKFSPALDLSLFNASMLFPGKIPFIFAIVSMKVF